MVTIKKLNEVYQIDKNYVGSFLKRGFEIVSQETKPEDKRIIDVKPEKSIGSMTKVELIALAEERNYELTGEEKINDLRKLLR